MKTSLERYSAVSSFLNKVCAQVQAKELHDEIKLEMISHLDELTAEIILLQGSSEEEAVSEALRQMGDPEMVGKQLHIVHKPKPEWSIIALVTGMTILGLVSLFALHSSFGETLPIVSKLIYAFIGVVAMIVLYFVDYRKLLRYSWPLYGLTVLLMIVNQLFGKTVNGNAFWLQLGPFHFNVYAASTYILIIAVAGILQSKKLESTGIRHEALSLMKDMFFYMLIPAFFYMMASAYVYFVIYCLSLVVLLLVTRKTKLLLTGFSTMAILISPFLFSYRFLYSWQRFKAFINPQMETGGFMTLRSVEAIQSGGMWGQGLGIISKDLPPYASSELNYSYLVYSLGWVFGIIIGVVVLLFVIRTISIGIKLQDGYAKGLVVGLSAVLGIQLVWNILMCLGLLPVLGISLPFISWSSFTVFELAAVGLMLGAYRRKDMFRSHSESSSYNVS